MENAFLDRLGLDEHADERAIRRAYARELKKIDPESDPTGFQALRESYEIALHWNQWKNEDQTSGEELPENEPASVQAEAAGDRTRAVSYAQPVVRPQFRAATPELQAPADIGYAAFVAFIEDFYAAAGPAMEEQECERTLRQSLSEERLINITAREAFEGNLAHLLSSGWRPGHEALFGAAARVFCWADDRRRLYSLGYGGQLIDRALHEREIFGDQPGAAQREQDVLIRRLRNPAPPTPAELFDYFDDAHRLVARFPTWLGMVCPIEQLQEWEKLGERLPGWPNRSNTPARERMEPAPPPPPKKPAFPHWSIFVMLFIAFNVVKIISSDSQNKSVLHEYAAGSAARPPLPASPPSQSSLPSELLPLPAGKEQAASPTMDEKEVSALLRQASKAENCGKISKIVHEYRIGTPEPIKEFGAALDRHIVDCASRNLWIRTEASSAALKRAIDRELERSQAALAKLMAESKKPPPRFEMRAPQYKSSAAPSTEPEKYAVPRHDAGSEKYRLDYKEPDDLNSKSGFGQ